MVAILVEVTGRMVLLIPDAIEKIKQKGREEERREWLAWYERQQAAFRDGLPFTEPPPDGHQSKPGK